MSSVLLKKTFSLTEVSFNELKLITEATRSPSDSHTIRELIRKEAKKIKKEPA